MPSITLTVNGKERTADISPDTPLLWVLRDTLGLTGTKYSCGIGLCGACTVHVDGEATQSCTVSVSQVVGREITTIEGLPDPVTGEIHPVQKAFMEKMGFQCGFCTPGMIISAKALLDENPNPTEAEVREALSGNLCRCTGYVKIFESVLAAAEMIGGERND